MKSLRVINACLLILIPGILCSCSTGDSTAPTAQSVPANDTATTPTGNAALSSGERLALYRTVINDLKTTKNPPVDEDYNVVTGADVQASQNRNTGSPTAYTSSPQPYTSQSPSSYSSSGYCATTEDEIRSGRVTRAQVQHSEEVMNALEDQASQLARAGNYAEAAEYRAAAANGKRVLYNR